MSTPIEVELAEHVSGSMYASRFMTQAYAPCSYYKVKAVLTSYRVFAESVMKIGELGRATGTKTETIRYYEHEGLLAPPPRTSSGYRDYSPDDVARLRFIRRARQLGFSMVQVRQLLDLTDEPSRSCEAVDTIASAQLAEVEAKLIDLKGLRDELSRMVESCKTQAFTEGEDHHHQLLSLKDWI